MTFEEWWSGHRDFRLRTIPVEDPDDVELKKLLATVWDAAINETEKQIEAKAIDPDGLHGFQFDDVRVEPQNS